MALQGVPQAEVARRVGVTREAVRQWVAAWKAGGVSALSARPRRRTPRVALARVAKLLERMLSRSRIRLTTEQVRRLIANDFGVAYSASNVRSILHRLGFAYERVPGWRPAA